VYSRPSQHNEGPPGLSGRGVSAHPLRRKAIALYSEPEPTGNGIHRALSGRWVGYAGIGLARALTVRYPLTLLQARVLDLLYGAIETLQSRQIQFMTYEDIAAVCPAKPVAVRDAILDLRKMGLVESTLSGKRAGGPRWAIPEWVWNAGVDGIISGVSNAVPTALPAADPLSTTGYACAPKKKTELPRSGRAAAPPAGRSDNKDKEAEVEPWGSAPGEVEKPAQPRGRWKLRGDPDWRDNNQDQLPPPAPKKESRNPITRLSNEFENITANINRPAVSNINAQRGLLKWMLDRGFSEEQIIESFRNFAKQGGVPGNASRWDAYASRRSSYLKGTDVHSPEGKAERADVTAARRAAAQRTQKESS